MSEGHKHTHCKHDNQVNLIESKIDGSRDNKDIQWELVAMEVTLNSIVHTLCTVNILCTRVIDV